MRFRFAVLGALALGLLWACSGGGGSSPGPTALPTRQTPAPTPSPTPSSPSRPAANGDSFDYAGTLSENFTRFAEPNGPPTPSPVQTNAQTFTSGVTQHVAVLAGATFNGTAGLYDFATTESDVQASPAKTLAITTDAYYAFPQNAATNPIGNVTIVGSLSTTSDGLTIATTYGAGNGLVDVLPNVAGPILPANNAALSVTETDPDGQVTTRTTNADGSYVETAHYPDGTTGTATENADGSGTYSFPLLAAGANTTVTVGAVSAAIPPATTAIPISIVYAPGLFGTGATTVVRSIAPVWYPTTPPVLSAETYANDGAQALPAACNVPAGFGASGNQLVQTIVKVDTIFGEIDRLTTTTYTIPGVGVACVGFGDVLTQYYDYTGQTRRGIGTFATPVQITTTAETVGLNAETLLGVARRSSPSRRTIERGIAGRALAAATVSFRLRLERRRVQRHAVAYRRFNLPGGTL